MQGVLALKRAATVGQDSPPKGSQLAGISPKCSRIWARFIPSALPGVGHLDGLLATRDSLFVSDLSKTGNLTSSTGTGVIYQIKALVGPAVHYRRNDNGQIELTWASGFLERAAAIEGPWAQVEFQAPVRGLRLSPQAGFWSLKDVKKSR